MILNKINELRSKNRFGAILLALESAYKEDNITSIHNLEAMEEELKYNEWLSSNQDNSDLIQGEFEIKSSDETPMVSDCVNILDIFGIYTNHYRSNMLDVLTKCGSIIDYTGKFSKTDLFINYLSKSLTLLNTVYEKDPYYKNINELCNLLCDKSSMIKSMGTKEAPFVYEGLQLVFYANILSALALIPIRLRNLDKNIEELADGYTNDAIKTLLTITKDILGMKSKIGNSIVYVDAPKSEITKRAEDKITGSIYQTSSVLTKVDNNGNLTLAGECIENMLVIKNNGAITEASLLFKGLAVVSGMLKGMNLSELISNTYDSMIEILGSKNIQNADDNVTAKENECRIKIFLPMQDNFSKLDLNYTSEEEENVDENINDKPIDSPKIEDFDTDDSDWGL